MRPQQNRRISRRSNNGGLRRAPNPLTRNYESSGPDVKIRGNAQHIADKYLALARDAQASGDRIMGENYLQHAEHYMRIILSAQPAEKDGRPLGRADNDMQDDSDAIGQEELADMPQPVIDGLPGEVALIDKRGGYNNANGSDNDEGEAKYDRSRQRRRLPARRSSRPNREEGGEQPVMDKNRDMSARSIGRASGYDGEMPGDETEETQKPARLRKPRRPRAAESEADQPDV